MKRGWFPVAGLGLLVLATTSLFAQRGGRGGGDTPLSAADTVLHGSVVLPDEVVSLRLVRVEELCGGRTEAATFADAKGRFSIDLGYVDRRPRTDGNKVLAAPTGITIKPASMKDCSIRATLSGYRAQTVMLEQAAKADKTNLGVMQLQPLGKQETALISSTDGDAPKNARKDYDTGLDEVAKAKWKDAIGAMKKAVSGDPKFATAWLSLGTLQVAQKDTGAALKSFTQAMSADEKFAPPYVQAAVIESDAGQWAKVAEHTNKAIALDPDAFPGAYYLNAMANIRLGQADAARKSVAEGLRVDQDREFPDLVYMDGILLVNRRDAAGARKQFESYLQIAPNGENADNARQMLKKLPAPK